MSAPTFQPYQRAILAFLARAKDENDRIILWNGRLRWKSEVDTTPKPLATGPLRGCTAHIIIIDELADFPLDPRQKPAMIPTV